MKNLNLDRDDCTFALLRIFKKIQLNETLQTTHMSHVGYASQLKGHSLL